MASTYEWFFPLRRTHTGMLQGNGTLGLMIWGEGSVLRLTLGRADFWDHRGGMPWREGMSYTAIRGLLEQKDEPGLRALFERTAPDAGQPHRPTVLPIGRIELDFGPGVTLQRGLLNVRSGLATVQATCGDRTGDVRIVTLMDTHAICLEWDPALPAPTVRNVPAWDHVAEHLRGISFTPPEPFAGPALSGWLQMRPVDPPLCVGYRQQGTQLCVAAEHGLDAPNARETVTGMVGKVMDGGFAAAACGVRKWWQRYWRKVPAVRIPNERLQFLYEYGMYKFAGLTNPTGIAATLQGPWIEEYQMPPWSSDYHFNINVQMCYWPAYHGNCLEHLKPLFDMIRTWTPVLRQNARVFCGIDDGLMLPHAVDDRCTCMGGFWTGSVDHGCTAWVAQMMYRYYRYTLDRKFLRDTAFPFMKGAMRVYEEMLEKTDAGFALPVGVSPEYRGSAMNAWGRNASFQLACAHRLCEDLIEAAETLGETPNAVWREIGEKLPRASLIGSAGSERIGLWDGTDLEESHRHHSHLAGITPFDVFPAGDEAWRKAIERSLDHWIRLGPALWSGWCVPWAAMIHMRFGNGDAAEVLLELWDRTFTNEGHGTLHDVDFHGISLMGRSYGNPGGRSGPNNEREIMQMDAGMSCTAAVQEMLLHTRRGVNYVFGGTPRRWRDVSFRRMRTDGAFLVSAERAAGRTVRVVVESRRGGTFRLANPWPGAVTVRSAQGGVQTRTGPVLDVAVAAGGKIELTPAT
ncbi:MAG: hypothetical protein A3K18_33625 [Lentisphaerae bacterium RIFOXYA12_64_32]|nr:MAG: hypothetical protein A3K18_33625 [Lentisphaerae bacterium RIFOXYA12_64_32]